MLLIGRVILRRMNESCLLSSQCGRSKCAAIVVDGKATGLATLTSLQDMLEVRLRLSCRIMVLVCLLEIHSFSMPVMEWINFVL